MSAGDAPDIAGRLRRLLPRWFADISPVMDALLSGPAAVLAWAFSLIAYARLQTRIRTATDGWLDIIAADFFGLSVSRRLEQSDSSFRNRIITNLFRERATRLGVIKVMQDLTGRTPAIIEPQRPADTGYYGGGYGYSSGGAYGSLVLPFQAFVTAYRPLGLGIPLVAGYGSYASGYGVPSQGEYASMSMIAGLVTDADIYAALSSVAPVGTTLWANILS
jgi:hypothetical protein